MDIGLLILRLVVGLTLASHGSQKLFGAFGGGGLTGTGAYMEHLGFRPGKRNAEIAGVAELVGGALLALGLFTPLAAAAIIGVMAVAGYVGHEGKGFFVTRGGWEYTLVLGAAAAAIACTGPGIVSFDALLDLDVSGAQWGVAAIVAGLGAAAVQVSRRQTEAPPAIDVSDQATRAFEADGGGIRTPQPRKARDQAVARSANADEPASSGQRTQSRPSPFAR